MPQVCLPAGCIDAVRIALIDECTDLPIPGANSGYIFNCFRSLELTTNIEDGEETILRNDCGKKCFSTRACDELTNIGLSFELLNPDYELTNLLTGQSLIFADNENIGWYHTDGRACSPWVSVELFEQVPDEQCSPGHRYRRIVIPKVRFKPIPTPTREGQLRVVGFEGVSAAASISAWGTGPFYDSPFDFGDLSPTIETHIMEFFDSSLTETLEGQCGYLTVQVDNVLAAMWSGQDEITITDNAGANALCDADEIIITLADLSTITIPLPDPNVTVSPAPGCTVTISNVDSYTGGEQVIGVDVRENGESVGTYDANRGLAPGQYAPMMSTDAFWEEMFPGLGDDSYISWGGYGGVGCQWVEFRYSCEIDKLHVGFSLKDLYDGTVARTEIVSELGTFTVPVVDEWEEPALAWTWGSRMAIENASTYGLDWSVIRAYDVNDDLICEWTEPGQTWNGGPWNLYQDRCIDPAPTPPPPAGGPPIINNVVVTP